MQPFDVQPILPIYAIKPISLMVTCVKLNAALVYADYRNRYTMMVTSLYLFAMDFTNKPKKRTVRSMDGFVQPDIFGSRKHGSPLHGLNQASQPQQRFDDSLTIGRVDDFSARNGFSPNAQAPITQPGADKPAEIGEMESSHRGNRHAAAPQSEPKQRKRFSPFNRKHKEPKKRSHHFKLKLALKLSAVVMLLILIGGGSFAAKAFFKTKNIFKGGGTGSVALNKTVDPTLLKGEGDGRVNVLLIGKGGPGHDGPDLTDTLLVASIDPVAKDVALVSIPRDLWVKSPSGGQSKINAVYPNAKYSVLNSYTLKKQTDAVKQQAEDAGIKAIESTITNTLGIPIQYYGMVDFTAFKQAIDAVGGIDVNVTTQLYDPNVAWENKNNPLIAAVGLQHFDGPKALLYSRSREGSARGDFDRTQRQREIITALKSKILSAGTFANPLKINQLINAFGDHVSTDLTLNEMTRIYEIAKDINPSNIKSIGLADPPNNFVTTGAINDQSVVIPRAGLFNYTDIQSYIRNTLRDPYLKTENANVIILNGTETPGLATLKSTELKSYGYNVTLVADASTKTYTKTTLIDLTKGVKKYTKNYLEKRLGVKAVSTLSDPSIKTGAADFVIILGSNESASSN